VATIRARVTATTANALQNQKFAIIGGNGAVINLWGCGVSATDDIGLSIGSTEILAQGTDINIESSADVIDTDRDQLIFNAVVGPGQLYMPVTVTTEMQFLLSINPV